MPKPPSLDQTFVTLRNLLATHSKRLVVTCDKPGDYQVGSPSMQDRIGRPLFVAAVQTKKNYVSYHLMPVYVKPELLKTISPGLKKRMQGKACFNFTTIDPGLASELSALTRTGIAAFKNLKLPWAQPQKRGPKHPD